MAHDLEGAPSEREGREPAPSHPEPEPRPQGKHLAALSLAALGVVYGDIGTSPLYALRECFHGPVSVSPSIGNILGVLSLILWALIIVISLKYLSFLMQADNRGEGGVLALMALLHPWGRDPREDRRLLLFLGLFGTALVYGDGMITPAISVLSAIEGLKIATPKLDPYVVPITIIILILLFSFERRGTAKIGAVFGPIMLGWFTVIGVLGLAGIIEDPRVLRAINPEYGFEFFLANGWTGFVVLGAVFLVVTGGEALYADRGHFGARPIRLGWFCIVLPALLLNYFGQGALLLSHPHRVGQPFYHLAPAWALYPMIMLATAATVIASQAVVSGAFSLTRQGVQLGVWPRMRIVQTSPEEIGQIYIPTMNWMLMIAAIGLVFGFGSSSNLAGAYGVAVTTTMVMTTVLAWFFLTERWKWRPLPAAAFLSVFLIVDSSFFCANLVKIPDGGWFPLTAAAVLFGMMATWRHGRDMMAEKLGEHTELLDRFLDRIAANPPIRVPGTAIFMTVRSPGIPPMLEHHLAHNKVLHERVFLLSVVTEDVPRVPASERLQIEDLREGFYRMRIRYGFMQSPNVTVALRLLHEVAGMDLDLDSTTFYIGRETLTPAGGDVQRMPLWERVFSFLARNATRTTAFYNIPPERVVELGLQVEL